MTAVKCLGCDEILEVAEVEKTASRQIVRFDCPTEGRQRLGILEIALEPPPVPLEERGRYVPSIDPPEVPPAAPTLGLEP